MKAIIGILAILTLYVNVNAQILIPELADTLNLDSLPESVILLKKNIDSINLNANGKYVIKKEDIQPTAFRCKCLITCKEKTFHFKNDSHTMKVEMKGLKNVITELDGILTHFIYSTDGTNSLIITYELGELSSIGLMDDFVCYYYYSTPSALEEYPFAKY
jgi:hypothetical protein